LDVALVATLASSIAGAYMKVNTEKSIYK